MKDLPYITHDIGARNDPKLMDLQMDMGGQGLAIFWCLIEMLWENDGYIPANFKSIAFSLRWCKAAEVEKVVTGYALFEIEDGRIFSRSALRRITEKKERIEAAAERGRRAIAARWGKENGGQNTDVIQPQYGSNTDVIPLTNLHTNLLTNNNNINNNYLEIFFFRNVHDPAGETRRFVEYYQEREWKHQDGTPVRNPKRAALDWKPQVPDKHFDAGALRWYMGVWNACKNTTKDLQDARQTLLLNLIAMRVKDKELTLVYSDAKSAGKASAFIQAHSLAGDWELKYCVRN